VPDPERPRGFDEIEIAAIAAVGHEVSFSAGEELLRRGELVERFLVVLEGRADVTRDGRSFSELSRGDFAGEIGLVTRSGATATVTAKEPVRALAVDPASFRALLRRMPALSAHVNEVLNARIARDRRAGAEVATGLVLRLGVPGLLARFPQRAVWAAFVLLSCTLTIALLTVVAMLTKTPFVFPSVGASAFLFFFTPLSPFASPRNTVYGHAIGILCGWSALWLTGLAHAPAAAQMGVTGPRIAAAALSLSVSGAIMILLQVAHPPGGATAMIIALGLVTRPLHLAILEVAVVVLTLQAIALNRLARLDTPLWAPRAAPK
jgi:CBS domain-containing membrane protein